MCDAIVTGQRDRLDKPFDVALQRYVAANS